MRVVETFDLSIFEQLRALGVDVDLAIKLAVAGKSLAESLYAVELEGTEAISLFESFVKGQFGGLKGLIESDLSCYNTPHGYPQVNRWVKAGAFAEEMHQYAEATGCMSHQATHKKSKSTCYGTLFYYLENCDLTDPMVSNSTNLCHLDAMVDRVTTREALDRFLNLLAQNEHSIEIWYRILTKRFSSLHPGTNGYKVAQQFLHERPELGDMLHSLQMLGVIEWESEVEAEIEVEIEVELPVAPSFGDFIGDIWVRMTSGLCASEFVR